MKNLLKGMKIFAVGTIGILVVDVWCIKHQRNLYKYQTGAIVAITLIITMVAYMYSICTSYLNQLIEDEKDNSTQLDEITRNMNNKNILKQMKEDAIKMTMLKDEQ